MDVMRHSTLRLPLSFSQVPQPIPHPAVIALLTYNRENEKDSLDLESVVTKRWLKIAEETVYDYSLHAHPSPKDRTHSAETFNGTSDYS